VTIEEEAAPEDDVRVRYEFSFNCGVVGEAVVKRFVEDDGAFRT
jgi:hypothetical protein